MTYDIISCITNGYDTPYTNYDYNASRRVLFSDCEYLVNGWDVKLLESHDKSHPFDTVFNIRWHPFNYSTAQYVVWIDGSLQIINTVMPLVTEFANSNADIALLSHPCRNNIFTEYLAWITLRNYNKYTAYKWMSFLEKCGVDIYHSGLVQTNIIIFKNTPQCINFCNKIWNLLHSFDKDHADRLDQTIVSAITNQIHVFNMKADILNDNLYFTSHYAH